MKILGLKPLYFRPPYGSYNDLVLQVLAERGYKKVFLWSDDTGDANGQSVQYSQGVLDSVTNQFPNPRLVLSHSVIETSKSSTVRLVDHQLTQTAATQVMPSKVWQLQNAGYQLVAVDTCLGNDGEWPYQWVGQPGNPDGSWHC